MGKSRADSISLVRLRLDWALGRMEEFNTAVIAFLKTGPYEIIRYEEPEGNAIKVRWVLRVHAVDVPFPLRCMAGEIAHNLRASVDNLVWSVAQTCGVDKRLTLQFTNGPDHFKAIAASKKLDHLPVPILAWYRNEQTHERTNGEKSLLCLVNDVWNEDKHRLPALMVSGRPSASISLGGGVAEQFTLGDPVGRVGNKDGDEICSMRIAPEHKVNLKTEFSPDIGFSDDTDSARGLFNAAERHIRNEVVPIFEPFLK